MDHGLCGPNQAVGLLRYVARRLKASKPHQAVARPAAAGSQTVAETMLLGVVRSPPGLKLNTLANTKQLGWYADFEIRGDIVFMYRTSWPASFGRSPSAARSSRSRSHGSPRAAPG